MDRRRPEPDEIIDVEAPRPPIRPDQGYRVGAKISAGDAGRTRLAGAIAVGIVLLGMGLSAIGPLLPDPPDLPIAPVPSRGVATPLPDVAVLDPPATTRLVPVTGGGLRWLDPANGTMTGDPYTAPRGNLFVDAVGNALCVCLEVPWSDDRIVTRVTLRRYAPGGHELERATLFALDAPQRRVFGDPIQVDAALAPDGRSLWLLSTVRADTTWDIDIRRVDVASLTVDATRSLASIRTPGPDEDGILADDAGWLTGRRSAARSILRVSPDGSQLSVLETVFSDPGLGQSLPPFQEQRLVLGSDLDPAASVAVANAPHDATDDSCDPDLSGWATNRHFVTICSGGDGGTYRPGVRVEGPGASQEIPVGPSVGTPATDWLLDSHAGVLYRWSPLAHVFSRFDVASQSVTSLAIDPAEVGIGDHGVWPAPAEGAPPWAPLTGGELFQRPSAMVGSADGTLVYAVGLRSVADALRDDRIGSTGIWAFDARQVELVAHWAPTALYEQIGYAPSWERLMTVATAGVDADGNAAAWGTSIRFHDARTGDVLELLGDVEDPSGFVPQLLVPNALGGLAGF